MLCQNIKKIQLIYKDIFKKTYATTGLKWLVVWSSAADSLLKRLDKNLQACKFLIPNLTIGLQHPLHSELLNLWRLPSCRNLSLVLMTFYCAWMGRSLPDVSQFLKYFCISSIFHFSFITFVVVVVVAWFC